MIQVVLGVCGREGQKALDCSFQRRGEGMRLVRGGEGKAQNTGCCLHHFFLRLNQRPDFLKLQGDLQSDHADASGGRCGSVGRR